MIKIYQTCMIYDMKKRHPFANFAEVQEPCI